MQDTPTSGFSYLFKGFTMLHAPGIKRYVYIPLIINVVLFAIFFYFSAHYFSHFVAWLDHKIPEWLHWLNWIIWPTFILSSLFIMAYCFIIVANIIAAPFNSFLSEKVELLQTGHKPNEGESAMGAVKDMPRVMKREIEKVLYYIPRAVILLILFLIPGVNVVASILWFLFGCWIMAMQYSDYAWDNHKTTFQAMRKTMRKHTFKHLGFGCAVVIILMIPIVNFFVIPAAVIGATLMWVDLNPASQSHTEGNAQ